MKTTLIALSVATTLALTGCGGASSGSSSNNETVDIIVERGPVLKATLRDANGQIGKNMSSNLYTFTNPTYPIESYGGYIDMNGNGVVDAGDVKMPQLRLRTHQGSVMTLGTTLASDANLSEALLEIGYERSTIEHERPSTDKDIAALSDEVFKYCLENNITEPANMGMEHMNALKERIRVRKDTYELEDRDALELENELFDEIDLDRLGEADLDNLNEGLDNFIQNTPTVELSDEQKYTLAYMWNEERLAQDIYLVLNDLTPSQTLYNIATKAESEHVKSVIALIEKYDLNVLNTTDYSGGYSEDALEAYSAGSYSLDEITTLYETLYAKGSASLQDALEVGCMVEVTDINDLNEDIETAAGADDLVLVFENLRKGSYSHYWAFDNALKAQGVESGCCVLGDAYCKTQEEYPKDEHGIAGHGTGDGNAQGMQKGKH